MSFSIFQAGSTLYGLNQGGKIIALTLPTGVTLSATLKARFALMGNYAILVNSPSRPLAIDANLNVRVLCPDPPASKVVLSGVATLATGLSGTYTARQTYFVRDVFGRIIAESDYGPTAVAVTIAAQDLKAASIPLSGDIVSGSRFYRPPTGQSVYFEWMDLDGNTQTAMQDDLSDAGLATLAAPVLGTPPDLALIAEFKGRLFGVAKADLNTVYYSEIGFSYAWPADNVLPVPRLGSDNRGATGLIRRRDALGLGRANGLYQITGGGDDDIAITNISENCGIEASDSTVVYRDEAFFLWKDGIYRWGSGGLENLSDGKVRSWFTTNNTFNLGRLQYAFGTIDPFRHKYRLYLASAGSQIENCWIEYDIDTGKFWGPHSSAAMNPSAAFLFATDSGLSIPMVGGTDGYCRQDRKRRVDDTLTPIDFDVVTARHDAKMPDDEKYFGTLSVATKPQAAGTLLVTATVGEIDETRLPSDEPFEYDMTEGRQSLGRIGVGKAFKLRFRNNVAGEDVNLRGYEIDTVNRIGKR